MNALSVNQLPSTAVSIDWLDHPTAVLDWCAQVPAAASLALDTEFLRERTYYAQLALVQLSDGARIALIDPRVEGMPQALAPVLQQARPTLLHAGGEDHGVLQHAVGAVLHAPWDTQVAAVCAGLSANLGLRDLVRNELGVELDKDQTRSDWMARPLAERQLQYAAADVQYLHALHARLLPRIQARGLETACAEECLRLRDASLDGPPAAQPHWALHRVDEWDVPTQQRAWGLLRWRDARARASDRPRTWILPQPLLLALATRDPRSVADVEAMLEGLQQGGGIRRAESLWQVLQAATADPADFLPAPAALNPTQRRQLQALRHSAEQAAAAVGLPVEWLAPRRLLEAWARQGTFPLEWGRWRAHLLAPDPISTAAASATAQP